MCPLCYINAIIFLIFGSSAAAIANSPWVIGIGVTLTVIGVLFLIRGYQKNQGQGGLKRNLLTTVAVVLAFASGYLMAAYQTHDYFKERTHHAKDMMMEQSKEEMSLMLDADPIIMNPLNNMNELSNNMNELSTTIKKAIEINKESADMKADMRAEMMKHATVSPEDEVACSCPYHEQLEKEKDVNMNVK